MITLLLLRDWQTPQVRFPVKCSPTANATSSFFSEKIDSIRKEIGISSSYAEVTQIRPQFQK